MTSFDSNHRSKSHLSGLCLSNIIHASEIVLCFTPPPRLQASLTKQKTSFYIVVIPPVMVTVSSVFADFSVLPSHTCGTPGLIPNGVSHGSRYNIGDKIRYSCESGFVLEGHSILTCIVSPGSGAQWDFPSPFCRGKRLPPRLSLLLGS